MRARLLLARLMAAIIVTGLAGASASAQRDRFGWDMVRELEGVVANCPAAQMPPETLRRARSMHNPDPGSYVHRQLERMLRVDPASCPGIAATAVTRLRAIVGEPERAEVLDGFLGLARIAAEEGLGMAHDPALADRLGRIEWLFGFGATQIPRWTEAQQQAWLVRPATIALLEARLAMAPDAMFRQAELLAGIRLRRDLPGYDPQGALALLDRAMNYVRFAEVASDGQHFPPDYRRAVVPFFRTGMFTIFDDQQRALLRVGSRAAAAARTPEQRGQALRILFAGAVRGLDNGCALVAAQRRHFERVPQTPLAAGEAERIHARLANEYVGFLISDDPPRPRPIILRALIDPDGRAIYAEVRQWSGSRDRDHFAVEAWAKHAEDVDLSATARGRFVWTDLPPIPPRPTTTMERSNPRSSCR